MKKDEDAELTVHKIRERISFVIQNINLLNDTPNNPPQEFLFIAKSIAQNMNVLKRQLKSTYNMLPWEEVEFCLVAFISTFIKKQELNLFYLTSLTKLKVIKYLTIFAKYLTVVKDNLKTSEIDKLSIFPDIDRNTNIEQIMDKYLEFKELYDDYQQICDISSVERISKYADLASSVDPTKRDGQLVILRCLQVIGECMKNTLESPKMSYVTSDRLLLSLPKNTRKIVTNLRNSLTHMSVFSQINTIQANVNSNSFKGIQNDVKSIRHVIAKFQYTNKRKTIKKLLMQLMESENFFDEIKRVAVFFKNFKLNQMFLKNVYRSEDYENIEKLINDLRMLVSDPTESETNIFKQINDILEKSKLDNLKKDYDVKTMTLENLLSLSVQRNNMNENEVRNRKYTIKTALENMDTTAELNNIKKIVELATEIGYINRLKMKRNNVVGISAIIEEIISSIEQAETSDIKSVTELRYKLNRKHQIIKNNDKIGLSAIKNNSNQKPNTKMNELKNILHNYTSNGSLDVPRFLSDKELIASIEMLMLDILASSFRNRLENNVHFLDYNVPILIGKSLRNHLAHYNTLVDILPVDPLKALILNAQIFTSEKMKTNSEMIGKVPQEDISKLKRVFEQCLISIKNQEVMFVALENSRFKDLKKCMAKGADVNARGIDLWTALHYAAKGGSVEIVQFLLNHNLNANVRDTNKQTPLHVAATYGSHDVIEFLIKNTNLNVDDRDNTGKTPLHIASENGFKNIVELLLKYKAKSSIHDFSGKAPLHYAVEYNYEDIAKLLLRLESSVDCNQILGGFTTLHMAAEKGHLNLVNFLLECKANVHAKTDNQATALHLASLNGYLDVVKVLILSGANVNARVLEGCTPLHYAIENGHEKIAELLLKNKAGSNISDRVNYYTPLHYAAKDGHEGILRTLLRYKADATAETKQGLNPMFFAIQSGHTMIVDALLSHGVDVNYNKSFNYIDLAIDCVHKPIVFLLLKHKINVNIRNCDNVPPIFAAALKGDKDIFDALIEHGAATNVRNLEASTLLHAAAEGGNKDIIAALIQRKADVNAKCIFGDTPIYEAVRNGNVDAVKILIDNNADIHSGDYKPLYVAACNGYKEIVELLLSHGADIDAVSSDGSTALHEAITNDHRDVFEVLLTHKARIDIKTKCDKLTPLSIACKSNKKDMVEMLINRGADVNADGGFPLFYAVSNSNVDVINILLNKKANIHKKYILNSNLLHLAVTMSDCETIKFLLSRGINVNCEGEKRYTPLHMAVDNDYNLAVDILLSKGANIHCQTDEGLTPLHIAAYNGYSDVVETLLNRKNFNTNIKDNKHRIALELAVANNHLEIVKLLLSCGKINLHNKGQYDFTILHIAAQTGHLEIVRYLVDNGADINAKNDCGSKPIHIAAREGHTNLVEFFCERGQSVDEVGTCSRTLLHYTADAGQLEVAKYLIAHGADINANERNGITALQLACFHEHQDIVNLLLESGARYNTVDMEDLQFLNSTPNVFKLLKLTDNLFKSVKNNDFSALSSFIKAGVPVNARNKNDMTVLHYATWKGYEKIIDILLENNSDPNMTDEKGFTSLHYAAKFNHLKILKVLLANGAVYNAVSKSGKSPENLSSDKNISKVLNVIEKLFLKVEKNDSTLIKDLKRIDDNDDAQAILGTRNAEYKTLVAFAICTNYSKIEELKDAFLDDLSGQEKLTYLLCAQEEYEKALKIYEKIVLKRKKILGDNNISTLDAQSKIAGILYKQQKFEKALNMYEKTYQKQKELLGDDKKDTLDTKSKIALILHRQGKNEKALNIYKHVYRKQKEILPNDDIDILNTQLHMALVLDALRKYDEALELNYKVYESRKAKLGKRSPATLSAQNNIGMVLSHQGKYDDALQVYQNVLKTRREVLGPNHSDTIRPLSNIASVYVMMNKFKEALMQYQGVLKIQKEVLGLDHLDTLNTQVNIGNLLFYQGKHISALKVFNECIDRRKKFVGSNLDVLGIDAKIEAIKIKLNMGNQLDMIDIIKNHDTSIKNAISCGDFETVQCLLQDDVDIDLHDSEGRTLLHFAVDNGSTAIVNMLIEYDASVNVVTKRGNTPLHIACSKGHTEITSILLQKVSHKQLNSFINAKTTGGGNTSLHVAAKKGHFDIVKLLLKFGAIYNLNNSADKTPLDIAEDQNVTSYLMLVKESYEGVKMGDANIVKKLSVVKSDKLLPILYARDNHENSLIQVAILNKHQKFALKLVTLLKNFEKL
ncbi:uncharacterized protein LOC103318097 [Nasonia vitripennis]|uniref:Uncharacterized protein n=1 Tax=Nasonia vitripennis TaxID=7425 RepID=A0A7M7HDZ9_NASVI|nr:uncharacterized protein LOC103318097 [Nasonia vitripennis]